MSSPIFTTIVAVLLVSLAETLVLVNDPQLIYPPRPATSSRSSTFKLTQIPKFDASQRYVNFSSDFTAYVDAAVETVRKCYRIPGVAVAAVDRRQTATDNTVKRFTRGYGVRDTVSNAPVDENTRFAVGSITKSFTAATFGALMKNNATIFDFDSKVAPLLTSMYGADVRLSSEEHFNTYGNFRDLMSHRTAVLAPTGPLIYGSDLSVDEMVKSFSTLPVQTSHALGGGFRESFIYNNWMFALVGAIMANATGKSYEQLVRDTVLKPSGMQAKFLNELGNADDDNFALSSNLYVDDENDGQYKLVQYDLKWIQSWMGTHGYMNPPGGLAASAVDMARYIEFWTLSGNGTIQLDALAAELNNPQTSNAQNGIRFRPPTTSYLDSAEFYTAFGLFRGEHNNSIRFTHPGGLGAYLSTFSVFLGSEPPFGVFIATNGPGGLLSLDGMTILEQALLEAIVTDGHPNDWTIEKLCVNISLADLVPHAQPLSTNKDIANAQLYTGQYSHPLQGTVHITQYNSTHLQWTLGTMGTGFMSLTADSGDIWHFTTSYEGDLAWVSKGLYLPGVPVPDQSVVFYGGEYATTTHPATAVMFRFVGAWMGLTADEDELVPKFNRTAT